MLHAWKSTHILAYLCLCTRVSQNMRWWSDFDANLSLWDTNAPKRFSRKSDNIWPPPLKTGTPYYVRWALRPRFLSVRLSVSPWLDQNSHWIICYMYFRMEPMENGIICKFVAIMQICNIAVLWVSSLQRQVAFFDFVYFNIILHFSFFECPIHSEFIFKHSTATFGRGAPG